MLGPDRLVRLAASAQGQPSLPARGEDGLQQSPVGSLVVDDEHHPCVGHLLFLSAARYPRTCPGKASTSSGLVRYPSNPAARVRSRSSGIAYAQGHIFMAGLRGERLWAIPVADGRRTGEPEAFFTNEFGRLRTVETAPDGSLWLTTSNTDGRGDPEHDDDRILRITISR